MRLIDADALKRRIVAFATGCNTTYLTVDNIIMLLNQSDSIDPESLREQGEWRLANEEGFFIAECSVCGMVADATRAAVWDYCPNCGARMGGGD